MTDKSAGAHRNQSGLPVVGGLLRRQRQEAERVACGLVDTVTRDSSVLDKIVDRLDIDAFLARLDLDLATVSRRESNSAVQGE
jgi:hypothetical protein